MAVTKEEKKQRTMVKMEFRTIQALEKIGDVLEEILEEMRDQRGSSNPLGKD
jgi:hypothetical protein